MNWDQKFTRYIDEAFPDEVIIRELTDILWSDGEPGDVEINSEMVEIPRNAEVVVVTKAFFSERFDIGFGTFKLGSGFALFEMGRAFESASCCNLWSLSFKSPRVVWRDSFSILCSATSCWTS